VTIKAAIVAWLATLDLPYVADRVSFSPRRRNESGPAVVLQQTGRDDDAVLEGGTDGVPTVRIELRGWAVSAAQLDEIFDSVRTAVNRLRFPVVFGDRRVVDCRVADSGSDTFFSGPFGDDVGENLETLTLAVTFED